MTRVRPGARFRPAVEALEVRLTPAVSFAGQQTFGTGGDPAAVAVADVNGDGKPDLVLANSNDHTVSVLLNISAPEAAAAFAAQKTFAVGASPFAVVAADVNGDGKPDLAVADYGDNTVSVLLNTTAAGAATPSFAAQRTFTVGAGPQAITAADLNGDGKPDLIVANLTAGTVSVLLNTSAAGSVSFAAQQTFAVGTNPIFVATADVNGDGKPDLAVTNIGDNTVSVLANQTAAGATSAAFAAQQTFAVGGSPIPVVAVDLNGDGKPDLAVANSADQTVSVLLNTSVAGSVSFAAQQTFAVGQTPQGLVAADLSGDGKPDLAAANFDDGTVSVLVNATAAGATTASFAAQQTFATGTNPVPLAAADFNGDGQADLAVANNAGGTVGVLGNLTLPLPAAPTVVAQFGSQGVWQYHRDTGAWTQLTAANAALLAADAQGDVVGVFRGQGVWEYTTAGGWKRLNGVDASLVALNATGTLVAEFPGYGVGEYLPGAGWWLMTKANAAKLTIDAAGDVAADFPGYGLWLYTGAAGWKQIDGLDPTALTLTPQGDVVADFQGYGVWHYGAGSWAQLNGADAHLLAADAQGHVLASFAGVGVGRYVSGSGWSLLTAADASHLGAGGDGQVFGTFPGYGVWVFDPNWGWYLLDGVDPAAFAVG